MIRTTEEEGKMNKEIFKYWRPFWFMAFTYHRTKISLRIAINFRWHQIGFFCGTTTLGTAAFVMPHFIGKGWCLYLNKHWIGRWNS
jgi:hypothetical protein